MIELTAKAEWRDGGSGSDLFHVGYGVFMFSVIPRIAVVYRWGDAYEWVLYRSPSGDSSITEPRTAPTLEAAKAAVEAALRGTP